MSNNTLPWNGRDLYLFLSEDKKALDLRTARDADAQSKNGFVFKPSQLEQIFATIAGSGFPMKSQNFVMYGKEKREGWPIALIADIKKPYEREGKTLLGSHAYTQDQLNTFEPMAFVLKTKFIKRAGGRAIPAPLMLCYSTAFERTLSEGPHAFQRAPEPNATTPDRPAFERKAAKT